jgi:hypothetical protein
MRHRHRLTFFAKKLDKAAYRKCPWCGGRWGTVGAVPQIMTCGKPDTYVDGGCPTCGAKPPWTVEFVFPSLEGEGVDDDQTPARAETDAS